MALFELENGRLVPAQFGRNVPGGFTDEVLAAIRSQVLEIVSRPLFPIAWAANEPEQAKGVGSRLTALDASGQVVAVEVMRLLDADGLIDSLSRLADTASLSWAHLAREYPLGADGFRREWVQFREAMPPSPPNGPRLILVTSEITDEVRPALDVLSSSGVEVHQMSLRQMASGRAFLHVDAVGPRLYGHRANSLLETSAVLPALGSAKTSEQPAEKLEPATQSRPTVQPAPPAVAPSAPTQSPPSVDTPSTRSHRAAATADRSWPSRTAASPRVRVQSPFPSRRRAQAAGAPVSAIPVASRSERHRDVVPHEVKRDAAGLALVARSAGGDTPLFLKSVDRTPSRAQLSSGGLVVVPAGRFTDPTAALHAEGIWGSDGWVSWRLGSPSGPSLAEAIAELGGQAD